MPELNPRRVSTKVDAKNQKVENVYDVYGRVTMVKRYPASPGAEDVNQRTTNTYDYDGSNSSTRNLRGRLAAVTVPNSVAEHYSYTSAGLLTSKVSDFGGGIYMLPTVDYSYDNEGKLTQMVYPQYGHLVPPSSYAMYSQRLTLNYSYDSLGQLQGMTASSGSGTNLVTSATYNAAGQLLTLNRPNSVTVDPATELPSGSGGLSAETFQYNGRNQLTRQTFLYSDINYRYSSTANDGRLTQKKNWISTEEENYTYDSLGRLATAYTTGPEWGLSWVYDGFGNRLQQNVTCPYYDDPEAWLTCYFVDPIPGGGPGAEPSPAPPPESPDPVQPVYSDVTGLQSAGATAVEALQKEPCKALFSGVHNPADVLQGLLVGNSAFGKIDWRDLDGPSNGSVSAAVTVPILGRSESGTSIFTGAVISINQNLQALWANGYPDLFDIEHGDSPSTQNIYRAITLIHELGHLFNYTFGAGSSQIVMDGVDQDPTSTLSRNNTRLVYETCFK
ncbi:hypothetical protein [Paludibaculum fermentans]|uniref:hypothetical protein n=1 Tax=Paludibaculum fermentans TaxID=1473598 RepID=UPI003EBB61F5